MPILLLFFFSLFFCAGCSLVVKPERFSLISTKEFSMTNPAKTIVSLSDKPIEIERCAKLAWIFKVSGEEIDRTTLVSAAIDTVPGANAIKDVEIEQDTFTFLFLYNKPCKRIRGVPLRIAEK